MRTPGVSRRAKEVMPIGKNFCTKSLRYQCNRGWNDLGWTDAGVGGEQGGFAGRDWQVAEDCHIC